MRTSHETRLRVERLCYCSLIATCLIAIHLFRLQLLERHDIPGITTDTVILQPRRGGIYTRDGVALAVSPEGEQVCANPRMVRDKERAATLLSPILGTPREGLFKLLSKTVQPNGSPNRFVLLRKQVNETTAQRVRQCNQEMIGEEDSSHPPAIYSKPFNYREYPRGDFASQLVGFVRTGSPQRPRTKAEQAGVSGTGIEYYWDNVLAGRPGKMQAEVDARGNPIPNGRKRFVAPVEGKHVILTIDDKIQFYTEQALQKTWERYHPNWVTAIAMCPKTGEILAMATRPGFDPNHLLPDSIRFASNPAVGFPYEPGSTFKIVTASAVLQDLPPEVAQKKFNCSGTIQVGKHTIHCWILAKEGHGHGPQNLADGIKNSCNIAMVGFSKCLGPDRLYNYARLFGAAERTGLGCPYERTGDLPAISTWDSARLANISFGQSLTVTPIQLLRAVCTIANGGEMMQPFIVRELRSQEGDLIQSFHPKVVRQVVTQGTAGKVAAMMERVVSEGTGKLAAVPGYHVAGKTGSAQKVEHGVYARGKFVSSFVGFLPAEDPKIAVLVVADEPKGSHWGSVVCGPAFAEIASKSMMRLKVEPALIAERPTSGSDFTP